MQIEFFALIATNLCSSALNNAYSVIALLECMYLLLARVAIAFKKSNVTRNYYKIQMTDVRIIVIGSDSTAAVYSHWKKLRATLK